MYNRGTGIRRVYKKWNQSPLYDQIDAPSIEINPERNTSESKAVSVFSPVCNIGTNTVHRDDNCSNVSLEDYPIPSLHKDSTSSTEEDDDYYEIIPEFHTLLRMRRRSSLLKDSGVSSDDCSVLEFSEIPEMEKDNDDIYTCISDNTVVLKPHVTGLTPYMSKVTSSGLYHHVDINNSNKSPICPRIEPFKSPQVVVDCFDSDISTKTIESSNIPDNKCLNIPNSFPGLLIDEKDAHVLRSRTNALSKRNTTSFKSLSKATIGSSTDSIRRCRSVNAINRLSISSTDSVSSSPITCTNESQFSGSLSSSISTTYIDTVTNTSVNASRLKSSASIQWLTFDDIDEIVKFACDSSDTSSDTEDDMAGQENSDNEDDMTRQEKFTIFDFLYDSHIQCISSIDDKMADTCPEDDKLANTYVLNIQSPSNLISPEYFPTNSTNKMSSPTHSIHKASPTIHAPPTIPAPPTIHAPPTIPAPPIIPDRSSSLILAENRLSDEEIIEQAKSLSLVMGMTPAITEPAVVQKGKIKMAFGKVLKSRNMSVPRC